MPIIELGGELTIFLRKLESGQFDFPIDVLKSSMSLKKIRKYADSQGIKLYVYRVPFGPFLQSEERDFLAKGTIRLSFKSISFALGGKETKIVLVPGRILDLLKEERKKYLPKLINTLLHEFAHLEKGEESGDVGDVIEECLYVDISCIYEEIEAAGITWNLYEKLRIKKNRKVFILAFLQGIFSQVHKNCFDALQNETCPLKDLIKKDKYFQNCIKPMLDSINAERIKPEQNP